MTTFHVTVEIGTLRGSRWEPVDVLVDTGSTFSTIPRPLLARVGIQPVRRIPFDLADGSVVESDVGEARVRFDGSQAMTIVVFGEAGEPALLGAHTLEALLLGVDPVNRRLVPVHALRMSRADLLSVPPRG
jgi:predicted aspartyl protease